MRRAPSPALPVPASVEREGPRLRAALLRWFDGHQRDLPWRRTRDPYAVWVSEIMLQQTQVDRVVPFYERFLARFPHVGALAAAPLDEVLSLWAGLGYYSRARNLHRAAQRVVSDHGGRLPLTVEGLRALPGLGRYTAGAVASIALGLEAPLVDGNVGRVFARLFVIEGPPGDRQRDALLWAIAERLVLGPRPGDFNQALMELGAMVCSPVSPACDTCPVRGWCGARAAGRESELPPAKAGAARKRLELAVGVAKRGAAVLLARRPEGGLFGGLWELPSVEARTRHRAALAQLFGPGARPGTPLGTVERTLTHRDLVLRLFEVEVGPALPLVLGSYVERRFVEPRELAAVGKSSATEAALALIRG